MHMDFKKKILEETGQYRQEHAEKYVYELDNYSTILDTPIIYEYPVNIMDKNRNLSNKIEKLLDMFPVVAVIGARQCGKSTLVKQLKPEWKYYDLEQPDDYQLITDDPVAFFSFNSEHIIIDEAQQYPDLFKILRGVIDSDRKNKGRFLITGSSSPDIVKGLTESLAGRIASIEMWPFKSTEYYEKGQSELYDYLLQSSLSSKNLTDLSPLLSLPQCMNVWYKGGFPEPLIESEENNEFYTIWMENYIQSYIVRDIRGLFPKLNIHNFRRFLTLLAQFSGHQLNMSDMARSLEVSVSTIKDYLDIIHQTFIWRNLNPFENNTIKKVQKAKKGFFRDQGVLHYLLKIKSLDDLLIHPVAGYSFESFVTEEIIRGFQATMATQMEFSYYRTIDKSEVDLIVEGSFGTIPIEIKLGSSTKKQSLRGLTKLIKEMDLEYGLVINRAKRIEQLSDKIIQIPVNYI